MIKIKRIIIILLRNWISKKLFWWDCLILSNSKSVISQVLIFYSSFLILYNKNIFPIIFLNLSNFLQ